MKARDTVMSDNQLYDILGVIPRDDEDIYDVIKKQAEITLKAVTDELKKQIEGVRANAFSVSLFGGNEHQLKMDAMVSAYTVVLNIMEHLTDSTNEESQC